MERPSGKAICRRWVRLQICEIHPTLLPSLPHRCYISVRNNRDYRLRGQFIGEPFIVYLPLDHVPRQLLGQDLPALEDHALNMMCGPSRNLLVYCGKLSVKFIDLMRKGSDLPLGWCW